MDRDPWCIILGSVTGPGIRNCGFLPCNPGKFNGGCEQKNEDNRYACIKHKSFPGGETGVGMCLPVMPKFDEDPPIISMEEWLKDSSNDCEYEKNECT